jgi:hypothetical protein
MGKSDRTVYTTGYTDSWSESVIVLGEIDETVQSLPQIEELKDIRTFIDPIEERIVDSSDELTNQIVARYNNIVEEEQEGSGDKVTKLDIGSPWNFH